MSKGMGIYVKFYHDHSPIWSCHVTLAANFENFYLLPNSILNFRKSYQIWGNWLKNKKVTGKKQNSGWKTPPPPPPPSAYRVKPRICQCIRQCFAKRHKFLSATSKLCSEQNLVHLGRFMHFSHKAKKGWNDLKAQYKAIQSQSRNGCRKLKS